MTDEGLAVYYSDQVSNERLQQGQEVFAQAGLSALERLVPLPRLRHVLDVGAGYGYLLAALRVRHGIQGIGVEPSTVESEYGRAHLAVDMRTSVLSRASLEHRSFDLVLALEVLEHMVAPDQFIAELAEYVAPGGYLVIGTDNFESAVVRALGPSFPKWIPHTHISHFSPPSLTRLMSNVDDFAAMGYTSYTPWEFWARWAASALRKPLSPEAVYDYRRELTREVSRPFKLYRLRKAIMLPWFRLTASNDLSGEMMFIALQRGRA